MITINAVPHTLSEVVAAIKASPTATWNKGYIFYLIKINNSGQATFANLPALLMKLAGYVMNEPKDDQSKLARYRGTGPTANSAMYLQPIAATALSKVEDRASVAALMATGDIDPVNGVTNKSTHSCDPETGHPKGPGVTVTEFYINGDEGRRATKRTENHKITYYYSDSHAYNTYKYQRLI